MVSIAFKITQDFQVNLTEKGMILLDKYIEYASESSDNANHIFYSTYCLDVESKLFRFNIVQLREIFGDNLRPGLEIFVDDNIFIIT